MDTTKKHRAAILLHSSLQAFNEIPNKRIHIIGYQKTYDLAAAIGNYLKEEGAKYHNATFKEKMQDEYSNYKNLTYSIDRDEPNNVWTLTVQSTSSSELDGSEEGILDEFSYTEAREIIEDIQQAEETHYPFFFDEL